MTDPSTMPGETWTPDAAGFLRDLEAKPQALTRLAASTHVRHAITAIPPSVRRIVFMGMGSSRYAAEVAALRLRAHGLDATAEYASARRVTPAGRDVLAVAISATGRSPETIAALARHTGLSRTAALTNDSASPLAGSADLIVPLDAGPETGGVACRTFQHTGLILRLLEAHLTGSTLAFEALCERVAAATQDLLDRRGSWLAAASAALDGPDGIHVLAPVERSSSAAQSALMFREGPRRAASAAETGDWNHVDVYLTKTTDYRALLLTGSPQDAEAMSWLTSRGARVVAVGAAVAGANEVIEYRHSTDEDVALHAETLIAELLAARWWQTRPA